MPLSVLVPITPVPASRPRVTKWGTYYSKTYKQWMHITASLVSESSSLPIAAPVKATVLFAIPRSRTSTLIVPVGDGDNYEKAIYDLLQKKGYLADDKWITTAIWRKRFLPHGTEGYTLINLTDETEEIDIAAD